MAKIFLVCICSPRLAVKEKDTLSRRDIGGVDTVELGNKLNN
jgi:hypothetical protein